MQWTTVDQSWVWFGAAAVLVVLVIALVAFGSRSSKPKPANVTSDETDGWTPTGRIDLTDAQATGSFILQVEETRIVEGVAGVEHREIRWRRATLDEAKAVLVAYYAQRSLAMTPTYVVSSLGMMRQRNSGLVSEQQEAQPVTGDVSIEKSGT